MAGNSPKQKIDLGRTMKSQPEFHAFLNSIKGRFTADTYDILKNNCNNFTNEASMFLVGKPIPKWITGLPEEAMNTPMGAMIKPLLESMGTSMRQESMVPSESIWLPHVKHSFTKSYSKQEDMKVQDIPDSKECPYPTLSNLKPICCGRSDNNKTWHRILMKKGNLSESQKQVLTRIVAFSKSKAIEIVPAEFLSFFSETLLTVPKKGLYSLLALFKNFLLKSTVTGFSFNLMVQVEKRLSEKDVTLRVAFTLACAALAAKVDRKDTQLTVDIAFRALESSHVSIRTAAAAIIYNIALSMPADSDDLQMAMVGTLTEIIGAETAASVLNRLLLALASLIQNNEIMAQLLLQMELDLSELQQLGAKSTSDIVRDIRAILLTFDFEY